MNIRNLSLVLLLSAITTTSLAAESLHLDDLISPEEISSEIQQETQQANEDQDNQFQTPANFANTLGFFDFLKPNLPVPPQPEYYSPLPQESAGRYNINWIKEYELVLVINKAQRGPTAQRLVAYHHGQKYGVFPVSTGRETPETAKSGKQYYSSTPTGWYSPTRLVRHHVSALWDAKMDYSVFFNGGIATHAALPPYFKKLGTRASGGCVRLLPEQALWIYNQVNESGRGLVPQFTRTGEPKLDKNGNLQYALGWKTLIVVVNREGQ